MDGKYDQNDGRALGDWKTRYPEKAAQCWIYGEAAYLGILLFLVPVAMLCVWLECPKDSLHLTPERYGTFSRYLFAWLAGTFGGVMFSIKWLYHTVARCSWNEDRHLWRFFCPHLSGGLAWMFYAIVTSGLVRTIDVTSLQRPCSVIACSFLVGYFSDSAIGKLKEIADTLFGIRREKKTGAEEDGESSGQKAAKKGNQGSAKASAANSGAATAKSKGTKPPATKTSEPQPPPQEPK